MTVSRWTTVAAVIVGGVMLATSAMSAQAEDPEHLKIVQQALKDRGHDPGAVDGEMGPKTEAALRDYQQKEGLNATGTADADTLARLTAWARTPATAPSIGSSATGTSNDGMATETRQTE
jgi:peptidoglycan hydrolase-like protein with peptidoglycan-binding domain